MRSNAKQKEMKIKTYNVCDQTYLTPYIKITYNRDLNGNLELNVGWLKWGITFQM